MPTETKIKNSPFTALDVCLIMEAGGKSGVTELKFRDLQIVFAKPRDPLEDLHQLHIPAMQQYPIQPFTPATVIAAKQKEISEEQLAVEEDHLRKERLEELKLTDPYEFEQMLVKGELDDEPSDDGDQE